jgi:hypothetical protein
MHTWKRKVATVFFAVITIGSIGCYWIVDRATNSQAPASAFHGWMSILVSQKTFEQKDRVWFQVWTAKAGDLSSKPLVIINIVVCGDSPFRGAVLLGGDARLSTPQMMGIKASPQGVAYSWEAASSYPSHGSLSPTASSSYPAIEAQVLPIYTIPITKCLPRNIVGDKASGTPIVLRGRLHAPLTRRSGYGPWNGPNYQLAWPSIGQLPGIAGNQLGAFSNPLGLHGLWFRPQSTYYRVEAGRPGPRIQVDLTRPSSDTGNDLTWQSQEPITPIARYVDTQSLTT